MPDEADQGGRRPGGPPHKIVATPCSALSSSQRCGLRLAIMTLFALASLCVAAPKRVLYVTTSAGYRHDSIPTSQQVLRNLGLDVVATEDLSLITADNLQNFDAVFFSPAASSR